MTKDFAKKRRRTPPKSVIPAWVWLFTGTVLGAFVMFLMYLSGLAPATRENLDNNTAIQTEQKKPAAPDVPKPRFDFYQLLKESEVVVKAPPPQTPKTSPAENTEFILQVGSFKSSKDADRLRAELILLNLKANIETVTVRNGEVWHRVLVGPFSTSANLSKARNTLIDNRFDTLLLKRKSKG